MDGKKALTSGGIGAIFWAECQWSGMISWFTYLPLVVSHYAVRNEDGIRVSRRENLS